MFKSLLRRENSSKLVFILMATLVVPAATQQAANAATTYEIRNQSDFDALMISGLDSDPTTIYNLDTDVVATANDTTTANEFYFDQFVGTFNGHGHTISGLKFPLFNQIGYNSELSYVENLKVVTDTSTGVFGIGILANNIFGEGALYNIQVTGTLTASSTTYAGAIAAGSFLADVDSVSANVEINFQNMDANVNPSQALNVGGLFGFMMAGSLTNAHFTGEIIAHSESGDINLGGLVGRVYGFMSPPIIHNVTASANETLTATLIPDQTRVGGLVGSAEASTEISNAVSSGSINVTGDNSNVGGMVGYMTDNATLFQASSSNSITITSSNSIDGEGSKVGGLVGNVENISSAIFIETATASGSINVTGRYIRAGGLVGNALGSGNAPVIAFALASGSITVNDPTGGSMLGGFAGMITDIEIYNSEATGRVNGFSDSGNYMFVGGFTGLSERSIISSSFANGDVSCTSPSTPCLTGGFTALLVDSSRISHVVALGNVISSAMNNGGASGGLVGYIDSSTISHSLTGGSVFSDGSQVGGFVGQVDDQGSNQISYSTALGNVVETGTAMANIGGFIGEADAGPAQITYNLSAGNVTAPGSSYVGGFIGYTYVVVESSTATGHVRALGGQHVGTFVGSVDPTTSDTITNSILNSSITDTATETPTITNFLDGDGQIPFISGVDVSSAGSGTDLAAILGDGWTAGNAGTQYMPVISILEDQGAYEGISYLHTAPSQNNQQQQQNNNHQQQSVIPAPVPVPDPVQQSKIFSLTPETVTAGVATTVTLSGLFVERVVVIQINGASISSGTWTQSPTAVSFPLAAQEPGSYTIQLFNGAAPVLATQLTVAKAVAVVVPSVPAIDTATSTATNTKVADTSTVAPAKPVAPKPTASSTPMPTKNPAVPKVQPMAKSITITCVHGKSVKKIVGASPKCPSGYVKK